MAHGAAASVLGLSHRAVKARADGDRPHLQDTHSASRAPGYSGRVSVDLYLGGPIGRWAIDRIGPGHASIRLVVSEEEPIRRVAEEAGYPTASQPPAAASISGGSAFSVHYPVIFTREIDAYDLMYNLHPGFLPWGRGYYPVFWAIWEGTPAGATLHEITAGVDKGPIVAQSRVDYDGDTTGEQAHADVTDAEKELFETYWQRIAAGEPLEARLADGAGSYHSLSDFLALRDSPPLDELSGRRLLDLARCLTDRRYPAPSFRVGTRRFDVTVGDSSFD